MTARIAVVILAVQLMACASVSAQGHLEPEKGILHQSDVGLDHWKRIRELLLKDAARDHLARLVAIPARRPELVVTVVREEGKGANTPLSYYVQYAGAESMLSHADDPKKVTIKRSRAPLDRDTAELLNKTWRRMLLTTRYPKKYRHGKDGVTYHFSRYVRGINDPLMGFEQGQIWSPEEDSPCKVLVAIGEDLKTYALAPPEDRDKVRKEIRVKLDQLDAKLDRLGQDE
jgi:hypothetical protein